MSQVKVSTQRTVGAPAERVFALLSDYEKARQRLLTEHYGEYEVREGGQGAGTVVHWVLAATRKRRRDCLISVSVPADGTLVEKDANSSMVTTWTVAAEGEGATVRIETTWDGAGGVGGFFEKTFAPGGLRRIYDGQLDKLEAALGAE